MPALDQRAGEGRTGELAALVGVEDLRLPSAPAPPRARRGRTKYVHRVRQPPRQNRAARPVDDRDEIEKAAADRDIGDVGRPHLVRPVDRQIAQQIREDLVARRRLRRVRLRSQRRDAHLAHQPLHALAVDRQPLGLQHRGHPPRAQERPRREQLVDPPHQIEVVVVGRRGRPIDARSRDAQDLALSPDRQSLGGRDRAILGGPARSSSGPPGLKNPARPSVGRSWRAASRSRVREPPRSPVRRRRQRPGPPGPEAASSRHRSGSGEPHSVGPDRPPSPAPAPPPGRSSPSAPRRSSVSSSSSSCAPFTKTERQLPT